MSFDVFAVIGAWGVGAVFAVGVVVVGEGVTATAPPGPLASASEAPAPAIAILQTTALQVRIHTATTSFVGLRG